MKITLKQWKMEMKKLAKKYGVEFSTCEVKHQDGMFAEFGGESKDSCHVICKVHFNDYPHDKGKALKP